MLNRYISVFKKDIVLNSLFWLFLVLILVNRIFLFLTVNINCIDNDQVVMWSGAKHFAQGLFYVPRYYGQDYNTMMEGLFAVPFIKLGLPVYHAVPLATHLIFLTPFLFTAFYLFFKRKKERSLFVLSILLCMPVGYDIMNSIPRGFITGMFFSSLFVVSLHNLKNYRFILINTFLAYTGYLVNQNSILVSAPFLFYLFLENYKDKKYYLYTITGVLLAVPIDYGLNHFYKVHPNYILYSFSNEYSFTYFKNAILNLGQRFAHISFFVEENSILILLVFALIGVLFYKRDLKLFYSYLLFLFIIFCSFFSSKISDGIVWPFFSYSRMYLGIPILIYLWTTKLNLDFKKIMAVLIPITLLFTVYKEFYFKKTIAYHRQEKMWGHVHLNTLSEILQTLNTYKEFCKEQAVNDFVMVNPVWHDDEINYAGPAVYDDFPNTFKPSFERRTWRIFEESKNVHQKFIVLTADYNFDTYVKENYKDIDIVRLDDYGLFLIKNNKRTTVDFIKHIHAVTDGF